MSYLNKIREEVNTTDYSKWIEGGASTSPHCNWENEYSRTIIGDIPLDYNYQYNPCLSCWMDKTSCPTCGYYKGYFSPNIITTTSIVVKESKEPKTKKVIPSIKNVIFNPPATIVYWSDGTKTVVKCMEGTEFNKYMGLAMCISEKAIGDKAKCHKLFSKWGEKEITKKKTKQDKK